MSASRKPKAAPLADVDFRDAWEAHDILFQDVHGVMTVLKDALHAEDHGVLDGEIDCVASGYAERACKTAASHIAKAQDLLESTSQLQITGVGEIHYALYDLQALVELAALALNVERPLHGERCRYPALTAVTIAARESYKLSCRLDEWIVAQKKAAA